MFGFSLSTSSFHSGVEGEGTGSLGSSFFSSFFAGSLVLVSGFAVSDALAAGSADWVRVGGAAGQGRDGDRERGGDGGGRDEAAERERDLGLHASRILFG